MNVHDKNLDKLEKITDVSIEYVDVFTQEQVDRAIAALRRMTKAMQAASRAFAKVQEELPEEVDTDPEE